MVLFRKVDYFLWEALTGDIGAVWIQSAGSAIENDTKNGINYECFVMQHKLPTAINSLRLY